MHEPRTAARRGEFPLGGTGRSPKGALMSDAAKPAAPRPAGRAGRNTELPEHLKSYRGVWVFIEHDRGHVHPVSWELMGEARQLADKLGVTVSGVLLGGPDEALDAFANE